MQAGDLVFLEVHARVTKRLVPLAEAQAGDRPGPVTVEFGMSQSDLAAMLAGSRQSVNQILNTFDRRGFVDIDGRMIVVNDLPALRRRAGLL